MVLGWFSLYTQALAPSAKSTVAPSLRVRLAVLMHYERHRLIEERQLVILDIDHLKLRILAAFQNAVCPLCDSRTFRPGRVLPTMIPTFSIFSFLPSGTVLR
jgi:hypothetical protein